MNPNECKHGRLARKCELCEYEREIAELRSELEERKQTYWQVVATRNEALNAVGRLRSELAMATDAANKGDKARHEIQAVIDERDQLRAEVERLQHEVHGIRLGHMDLVKKAVTRCANVSELYSHRDDDMGSIIAKAILKEFNL